MFMEFHLISMVYQAILFDLLSLSSILLYAINPMVGETDFTVKKSLDFCNQMKHVKLEEDNELFSLDVVFLFTSIPVKLAIQVATDVFSKDDTLQDKTAIQVEVIVDLVDFFLSTSGQPGHRKPRTMSPGYLSSPASAL